MLVFELIRAFYSKLFAVIGRGETDVVKQARNLAEAGLSSADASRASNASAVSSPTLTQRGKSPDSLIQSEEGLDDYFADKQSRRAAAAMGAFFSRDPPNWWALSKYIVDYLFIVVLAVVTGLVNKLASPAERTLVTTDPTISYPNIPSTVPDALGVIYPMSPPLLFIILSAIVVRSKHDLHNALLGLFQTLILILFNFELLKNFFGEYRPDFMARCTWDPTTQTCTGAPADIAEGRKAFPSGHSGMAWGLFLYGVIYLVARTRPFRNGLYWIIIAANLSLLFGAWISSTRIIDNKHSFLDIFAGAVVGSLIALVTYLIYYEAPWGKHSGRPRLRSRPAPNFSAVWTGPENDRDREAAGNITDEEAQRQTEATI